MVSALVGNDGILVNTSKSKQEYEKAQLKESAELDFEGLREGLIKQDISINDSKEPLKNPDIGFYVPLSITLNSEGFEAEGMENQLNKLKENSWGLVHVRTDISYLSKKVNGIEEKELTSSQIESLNNIYEELRQNNVKVIVRFAYDFEGNENKEPDINQILKHVKSLKTFFEKNKDIITVIETGFLGPWGEGHTSDIVTIENETELLNTLLENVPKEIMINVRTPEKYQTIFGENPITESIAFSQNNSSRVGIFNDGYLSSETDLGTYKDEKREEAIEWLSSHTSYTIFGGETAVNTKYSDVANIDDEMYKTHTSYLNYEYQPEVIQKWENTIYDGKNQDYQGETVFKFIENHLGYRLLITDSQISTNVNQGGTFGIQISISNVGFGNIINEKKAELILEKNGEYYSTDIDINPRDFTSQKTINKKLIMTVPSEISEGIWNVYLKISDKNNDNYTIKFANENIWEEDLQANLIGNIEVIEDNNKKDGILFTQKYNINKDEGNNNLQKIEALQYTDGKKTTKNEWLENEIVKKNDTQTIYCKIRNNILYIYYEDTQINEIGNMHLRIATDEQRFNTGEYFSEFNYIVENSRLYPTDTNGDIGENERISTVEYQKNEGVEYAIPLSLLNVDENGIKGISLNPLDSGWNSMGKIIYCTFEF